MNAMKPTLWVNLTGLKEREDVERIWLGKLRRLFGKLYRVYIRLPSQWEEPAPWNNPLIKAFVSLSRQACGRPPVMVAQRGPTRPEWVRPGFVAGERGHGARIDSPQEWVYVYEHAETVRRRFECDVSGLNNEYHGPYRDWVDLQGANRDDMIQVLHVARWLAKTQGVPLPLLTRPADALLANHMNWPLRLAMRCPGLGGMAVTTNFLKGLPDDVSTWRTQPEDMPTSLGIRSWTSYLWDGNKGISWEEWLAISWEPINDVFGTLGKPVERVVLTSVAGTSELMDRLAEVGAKGAEAILDANHWNDEFRKNGCK